MVKLLVVLLVTVLSLLLLIAAILIPSYVLTGTPYNRNIMIAVIIVTSILLAIATVITFISIMFTKMIVRGVSVYRALKVWSIIQLLMTVVVIGLLITLIWNPSRTVSIAAIIFIGILLLIDFIIVLIMIFTQRANLNLSYNDALKNRRDDLIVLSTGRKSAWM